MKVASFLRRLQDTAIAPSPQLAEPDERRQASLLSALLLGLIVLAVLVELTTIAFIEWETYTGYRQTAVGVAALALIYAVSRTRFVRAAAALTVATASLLTFYSGWVQPAGVLGGLLDFLILPLWFGSLYLRPRELATLIAANLIGLLIFPLVAPDVSLNEILVGPFSFIFVTSVLTMVITRHRNLLEQDRRQILAEEERQSRLEADRAEALLRVAGRLNSHLDLDALLETIGEEVSLALRTPVSLIALFDQREGKLYPASVSGLPSAAIDSLSPLPRAVFDQTVAILGESFFIRDLQVTPSQAYLDQFKSLNMRSIAFAAMLYERQLIGSLAAVTLGEPRDFSEDELLLLRGLADQAALAINSTRLYKEAHRRLEHLQALRAIDVAISSNHDLQATLKVVLDQIIKELDVDAALILLLDESKQRLEFGLSRGFHTSTLRYTSLRMGEGIAGRAAQKREIIRVQDLRSDPLSLVNAPKLAQEGFVSYCAAPLVAQGKVSGVLEVFHRSLFDPDNEWLGFLETLAGQAAIAVENTTLFDDLQRTNAELVQAYDATIEGWSHALDLRDKETEGHTQRVTDLTLKLARLFGFNEAELLYIRWGALLHDIGKMGVPDRILLKEGPLTEEEWVVMRQHPSYAHEMLRTIQYLRPALEIPYCHHEKWDGTGYPRGLKGEEIPLTARIFAVIDVWDALTSDRPYRAAWPHEKTLAHIRAGAGTHFDPLVVERFTDLLSRTPDSAAPVGGNPDESDTTR
jgi:putative nucleotidyltransferase with HDIG domain